MQLGGEDNETESESEVKSEHVDESDSSNFVSSSCSFKSTGAARIVGTPVIGGSAECKQCEQRQL